MKYFQSGLTALRRVRIGGRTWVILIVLVAFALRAYRLGAQSIWWDESLSVYRATRDLATVFSNIILIQNVVTYDTLPQLYFVLLHFFVQAWGTSEFAFRFFSLVANVATVPLLYVLAKHWFAPSSDSSSVKRGQEEWVGVVAALLGTLSPFLVYYSQEARPYTFVLFVCLLAVYALTRAFPASSERQFIPAWLAVYVLAAAASLWTHYYAIFLIPFHAALIAILVLPRAPRLRAFVLLPLLPLATGLPLVPQIIASMAGNVNSGPSYVPFDIILRDLLNSFSVGVTIDFGQVFWIDLALLAVFVIGLLAFRRTAIFLLAYLAIPLLGLAAASLVRPLYQNSRYFTSLSPAFYLGVAAGIIALAQRWKVLAVPALGVFLIGAVLSLNHLYFDPLYGRDDHRAWAEYLREHVRPDDFLILDSPHTEELYRYYADSVVPMTTLPILRADGAASPQQDLTTVREAYHRNARVWFLEMHVPFDDPQARIEKILNQEGVLLDRNEFRGTSTAISLSLFVASLPVVQETEIENPMDVSFAGHLRLRGYAAPPSVQPGTRGVVAFYWQIDEPVGEDYAVSLRMVDGSGKRWAQWDSVPLGNRAGTSTWQPDTVVVDAHDLPIAVNTPLGTYYLRVVPYHSATGDPLGDVVTLGEIRIERRAAQ